VRTFATVTTITRNDAKDRSIVNAAEHYAATTDAVLAQRTRLRGAMPPVDPWAGQWARSFRADPHRALDPNLAVLASYVQPDDVLVDVGGGAGRLSLPLASRCREVVNVDGSAEMGASFLACATEAGITNARFVEGEWLKAPAVQGTIALVANVTYFVRDIVPFVRKLEATAPRRVMICVWSWPPPCRNASLYESFYGEEERIAPSYRELLPALWELDILPELRVLPATPSSVRGGTPQTREEAISSAIDAILNEQWAHWPPRPEQKERARAFVEPRVGDLFEQTDSGFRPRWVRPARELLITWEPSRS